jgi:hypothetical protein
MRMRWVHKTYIKAFWDINAVSIGKVTGVSVGHNALNFRVKLSKYSFLGLPQNKDEDTTKRL